MNAAKPFVAADAIWGEPSDLVLVACATAIVSLALLGLLRAAGSRGMVPTSAVDIACLVAVGAVVGRTTLLSTPTLPAGVVALVVLFSLHRLLGVLALRPRARRWLVRAPVVLVSDGLVRPGALRRARMSEDDLRQRLRLAGVARRDEASLVVLEAQGQISVLRGGPPEPWMIADLDDRTNVGRPAVTEEN